MPLFNKEKLKEATDLMIKLKDELIIQEEKLEKFLTRLTPVIKEAEKAKGNTLDLICTPWDVPNPCSSEQLDPFAQFQIGKSIDQSRLTIMLLYTVNNKKSLESIFLYEYCYTKKEVTVCHASLLSKYQELIFDAFKNREQFIKYKATIDSINGLKEKLNKQ